MFLPWHTVVMHVWSSFSLMVNIFIKFIYEHTILMLFPTEQLVHTDRHEDFDYFDTHLNIRHSFRWSANLISDWNWGLKCFKTTYHTWLMILYPDALNEIFSSG